MKIVIVATCILLNVSTIQSMEKIDAIVTKMRPQLGKVVEGLKAIDAMEKDGFNKWNAAKKIDENGNTRLHFAVLLPWISIEELIKTEDITAANQYGITPVIVALYNANQDAIAAMFSKNPTVLLKPESTYGFSFPDWIAITQAYKQWDKKEEGFEEHLIDQLAISLIAQNDLK